MTAAPAYDILGGDIDRSINAEAQAWLRQHAPVYRDEKNGVWGVATYDGVMTVSRDQQTFTSAGGTRPGMPAMPWMIDMASAQHMARRKLVSRAFTPARVRTMAPGIEATCERLVEAASSLNHFDLIDELAAPLPLAVIADMLGMPEADRPQLLAWSDALIAAVNPTPETMGPAAQALMDFGAYSREMVARRRVEPAADLVTVLVEAEIDGERLTDDDIAWEMLLLLIAGDETTRHVITGGMDALLRHPAQRQRVVDDPTLLATAVDEMARWVSPVKNMARTVTTDTELGGVALVAGEEVVLLYESANFDEAKFDDAGSFDVGRSPNEHLAFGFGPHVCLGASLARVEIEAMVRGIMRGLPELALASDEPPELMHGWIASLPVVTH